MTTKYKQGRNALAQEQGRVLKTVKEVVAKRVKAKDITVHAHFMDNVDKLFSVGDLKDDDFSITIGSVIRSLEVETLLKHLSSQLPEYNMTTRCQGSGAGDTLNLYIIFRKKNKYFEFGYSIGVLLAYFFLFTLAVCIGRITGLILPIVL